MTQEEIFSPRKKKFSLITEVMILIEKYISTRICSALLFKTCNGRKWIIMQNNVDSFGRKKETKPDESFTMILKYNRTLVIKASSINFVTYFIWGD